MSIKVRKILVKIFLWIAGIVTMLVICFPFVWIFSSSFTPVEQLFRRPVKYIPTEPTLENYYELFKYMDIPRMAQNTVILGLLTVVFCLLIAFMAAYSFSRYNFKGKKVTYNLLFYSQILPLIITLVPITEAFRFLKLFDTIPGLVFLYTSTFITFTTVTLVSFINQIPYSIEEAASVDGATLFQRISRIVLPLAKPAIGTLSIILFIWSANEFLIPLLFTSSNIVTLSVGIATIPRIDAYHLPWEKISAMAVIMLVPIIIFVLIFQKNIIEGLMAGSLKQ